MGCSIETVREIWDDDCGSEHIEVGPDRDGLNIIEIRYYYDDKIQNINSITLTIEQAHLVAESLIACANEISKRIDTRKNT